MDILASTSASALIASVSASAVSTFTPLVAVFAFAIGVPLAFVFFRNIAGVISHAWGRARKA